MLPNFSEQEYYMHTSTIDINRLLNVWLPIIGQSLCFLNLAIIIDWRNVKWQ